MKGYKLTTVEQKQNILDEYARTKSTRATANNLGMSIRRVTHCLKANGLELTRKRESVCHRNHDRVVQMAKDGATLMDIARAVGTNHHRVTEYLELLNIPYRPWTRNLDGNPHWKGGKTIDKSGYILVKMPDHPQANNHGYAREHRLVAEQMLGRYLLPGETVHHIDGNRQNNSPDNLRVYASNAEHLADTISGQVPNWTEQGKENIREGVRRAAMTRRSASLAKSKQDGS